MNRRRLLFSRYSAMQQAVALSLATCLILPSPAFALRQTGLEEQADEKGQPVPGSPKAKLVAALKASPATVAVPFVSPTPLRPPAAGMEERMPGNGVPANDTLGITLEVINQLVLEDQYKVKDKAQLFSLLSSFLNGNMPLDDAVEKLNALEPRLEVVSASKKPLLLKTALAAHWIVAEHARSEDTIPLGLSPLLLTYGFTPPGEGYDAILNNLRDQALQLARDYFGPQTSLEDVTRLFSEMDRILERSGPTWPITAVSEEQWPGLFQPYWLGISLEELNALTWKEKSFDLIHLLSLIAPSKKSAFARAAGLSSPEEEQVRFYDERVTSSIYLPRPESLRSGLTFAEGITQLIDAMWLRKLLRPGMSLKVMADEILRLLEAALLEGKTTRTRTSTSDTWRSYLMANFTEWTKLPSGIEVPSDLPGFMYLVAVDQDFDDFGRRRAVSRVLHALFNPVEPDAAGMEENPALTRREFLRTIAGAAVGATASSLLPGHSEAESVPNPPIARQFPGEVVVENLVVGQTTSPQPLQLEIAVHETLLLGPIQNNFRGIPIRSVSTKPEQATEELKDFTVQDQVYRMVVLDRMLLDGPAQVAKILPSQHAPTFLLYGAEANLLTPAVAAAILKLQLPANGLFLLRLRQDDLGQTRLTIYA